MMLQSGQKDTMMCRVACSYAYDSAWPIFSAAAPDAPTGRRWHANVRELKFESSRQRLSQQLLLLKLPYLKLLMDCRAKMAAILEAGALQPVAPGLYKLDALVEQQQEYQQ
jgi:hypothetical protein